LVYKRPAYLTEGKRQRCACTTHDPGKRKGGLCHAQRGMGGGSSRHARASTGGAKLPCLSGRRRTNTQSFERESVLEGPNLHVQLRRGGLAIRLPAAAAPNAGTANRPAYKRTSRGAAPPLDFPIPPPPRPPKPPLPPPLPPCACDFGFPPRSVAICLDFKPPLFPTPLPLPLPPTPLPAPSPLLLLPPPLRP
jgi:hypothetical protein